MTTAALARRLERLERPHKKNRARIVIYDPEAEGDEQEESASDESRISIYIPDNGRDDRT
jgi:hypothetical protein